MKIGFIGAGKVGFSLGKYFTEHNLCVSGYYSRNSESSKEAAAFTKTKSFHTIQEVIANSDTLFLTVPDGTIQEIYSEILKFNITGKCLVHCSGALTSAVFSGLDLKGAFSCSVHPICAVSNKFTGYHDLSKAYFTVEGNKAEEFKQLISSCGNSCEILSVNNKVKYHGAAVFASNLVVALYNTAVGLLKECGLSDDFSEAAFMPLFLQNAQGIVDKGVVEALTGPVERGDYDTIDKHLKALNREDREIYRLLSDKLVAIAEKKNINRDYKKIKSLINMDDNLERTE